MLTTSREHKTKILATVGPASNSYEKILELARSGVDTFRLNFSHGTHKDHKKVIEHIVAINRKFGSHIGILADLQGPKIRIGKIEGNKALLRKGDEIIFQNKKCLGTKECVYMSYKTFPKDVKKGERVLVDDGKLVFEVMETNRKDRVKLKTLFGGKLSSNKGVNLPNTKISLPCLTKKDMEDLEFILTQPVNWIALSFVRSPKDLDDLRAIIDAKNHPAKIMAKIEKPEAISNFKKIVRKCNAIMIARGDLGIEVPIEQLPLIQKDIIKKSMQYARPVVVATQMLESMMENPSPTRAEVTDVANAVLDGADCLMLSGETAMGAHPSEVVKAMSSIIEEAEKNYDLRNRLPKLAKKSRIFLSDVICYNAAKTTEIVDAKAIIGMTSSGYTAFKVSSFRPEAEIFIFSDVHRMLSTLNLVWGVRCFYYDRFTTTDESIEDVHDILVKAKKVKTGDIVINTGSMPLDKRLRTNMMKISVINEENI